MKVEAPIWCLRHYTAIGNTQEEQSKAMSLKT